MHNYRKILAGTLAATMVLGSSFAAFADGGNLSGEGSLDIVEQSDVFNVDLPTVPENATTYDYILDPTGVIDETNAEKYAGKTFEAGQTVYFQNTTGSTTASGGAGAGTDYSHVSDSITAVNKSTMNVDISVTAKLAEAPEGITMVGSDTFTDNTDRGAKLYLALTDDHGHTSAITSTAAATVGDTIDKLDGAYTTEYDAASGKYVKELDPAATGFETYSFQLTGACNPHGEWTGLTNSLPQVDVVWTVENPTGPQVSVSSTGELSITGLTAEKNYADSFAIIDGEQYGLDTDTDIQWDNSGWSSANGGTVKGQFGSLWLRDFRAATTSKVVIKLTDNTTIETVVNIQ